MGNNIKLYLSKVPWVLLSILLLATLLRFVGLENLSPPLNRDEAGIGYNAYSLLRTGKDEHGIEWPLAFKSIGDYKMPGYIYLSMLPIQLFGLTVFATRFWSALGGVLAVAGIWFLAREIGAVLFGYDPTLHPPKFQAIKPETLAGKPSPSKEKVSHKGTRIAPIEPLWLFPAICAFFLAINPWHVHYSRLGFEANLNLTVFIWLMVFYFWSLKKTAWMIGVSLCLVVMQFLYSSTFIFMPLFGGVLGGVWIIKVKSEKLKVESDRRDLITDYKLPITNWMAISFAAVILVVGSYVAFGGVAQVSQAKQAITVFSDPYLLDTFNQLRGEWNQKNPLLAKIWFNKPLYFGRIILLNYLNNIGPGFLFFNHIHHVWHSVFGHGFFYGIDGLWFVIGAGWLLYRLIVPSSHRWLIFLLFSWYLLAPAASVITVDAPHATRSLYMIPIFLLFSSLGVTLTVRVVHQWLTVAKQSLLSPSQIFGYLVIPFYLILLVRFGYQYIVVFPNYFDPGLLPGIQPVIEYVETHHQLDRVYVADVDRSPYLYALFFGKIDPNLVQQTARWKPADTAGLTHIEQVGRYHFVSEIEPKSGKNIWIVQGGKTIVPGYNVEKVFLNPRTKQIDWRVFKN